ncbi:MAG: hypothetical protein M3220_03690 [Chloroflexota bacterium]|nr:hypothetical protein [Chloroflexota bacterium]
MSQSNFNRRPTSCDEIPRPFVEAFSDSDELLERYRKLLERAVVPPPVHARQLLILLRKTQALASPNLELWEMGDRLAELD